MLHQLEVPLLLLPVVILTSIKCENKLRVLAQISLVVSRPGISQVWAEAQRDDENFLVVV